MTIKENILELKKSIPTHVTLVAVTKTHPVELLQEALDAGHFIFGENRVQELLPKHLSLSKEIQWHLIGHLQTNKVKEIASFISLIHSIDSFKLLKEVNKQAEKNGRIIDCLLQIFIAKEETKFGLDNKEAEDLLRSEEFRMLHNIRVTGLMGMATHTTDSTQVRTEFRSLKNLFESLKQTLPPDVNWNPKILSMGMSSDYKMAIEEGSTMIRVGSAIFGNR
jgi:pyridoxal phosphate enzyme (YggS family)